MEHSFDKNETEKFRTQFMELAPELLQQLLGDYDAERKTAFLRRNSISPAIDLQNHLELIGLKGCCPYCGSDRSKRNGKSSGLQRYICLEEGCRKSYTLLTGTVFDKSKWSWDFWVRLAQLVITSRTVKDTTEILKEEFGLDALSTRSIYLARHKLIHAMNCMPRPKLKGVVQVDEIYLRENQKGTRTDLLDEHGEQQFPLINVIPDYMNERVPRYSAQPSLLGVTSPEYVCTVFAIDDSGHAITSTTNLGLLSLGRFSECFDEYLEDIDIFCSDRSQVYMEYCRRRNIRHYVRPVNLVPTLFKAGYDFKNGVMFLSGSDRQLIFNFLRSLKKDKLSSNYGVRLHTARAERKTIRMDPHHMTQANRKIAESLYKERLLDFIDDKELLSFEEFCELKDSLKLSLDQVNSLHDHLLVNLNVANSGVATKHFPEYAGMFIYLHNWEVDHGHAPSSKADAEKILIELLKVREFLTQDKISQRNFYVAPPPSSEYLRMLDTNSRKARKLLDNKFFKFDEDDRIISFDRDKFLNDLPHSHLCTLAQMCRIRGYTEIQTEALRNLLSKHPDIENSIFMLTKKLKVYDIYSEDSKYLLSHKLTINDLSYAKNIRGTILEDQSVLKSSVHGKAHRSGNTKK